MRSVADDLRHETRERLARLDAADRVKVERRGVRFALIGAGALAVHGVARSTFDLDLFTTDARVLDAALWAEVVRSGASVDVRLGDSEDPLAGVIRRSGDERDVDVAVGRADWRRGRSGAPPPPSPQACACRSCPPSISSC
jgi:hypothetical protein